MQSPFDDAKASPFDGCFGKEQNKQFFDEAKQRAKVSILPTILIPAFYALDLCNLSLCDFIEMIILLGPGPKTLCRSCWTHWVLWLDLAWRWLSLIRVLGDSAS